MSKRRQLALTRSIPAPLGSLRQVMDDLSRYNTAPDGSPADGMGLNRLYGPGMVVDIPANGQDVQQAMVTITEEEIAWPVLSRICKELKWKMLDLETGRAFG